MRTVRPHNAPATSTYPEERAALYALVPELDTSLATIGIEDSFLEIRKGQSQKDRLLGTQAKIHM